MARPSRRSLSRDLRVLRESGQRIQHILPAREHGQEDQRKRPSREAQDEGNVEEVVKGYAACYLDWRRTGTDLHMNGKYEGYLFCS